MEQRTKLGHPMGQTNDSDLEESGWLLELLKFAPKFYWSSIPLILNLICPAVLNISSQIFFGWYKDATLSAGFGLSITLYLWFFLIPQATNCEIVGIQCSKANGAQDYKLMRLTFLRAIFSNFCIVIFALIAYSISDKLLIAIGMEPTISQIAHICILWQAPAIALQSFNEILKSYMISLGYYAPQLYLNLGLALSYPIQTYLLIWELRLGIYGFAIIAVLREIVDFQVLVIYFRKKATDKEKVFTDDWAEVMPGFGGHWRNFFKLFFNIWMPYAAWEINTFLQGQLKDNNFQAGWVCIQALCVLVYNMGAGMGQMARTGVSCEVGRVRNDKAKTYAQRAWAAVLFIAVVHGGIYLLFGDWIASVFTKEPKVEENLKAMLWIFGFITITDLIFYQNTTLLRIVGWANFLTGEEVFMFIFFDSLTCQFLFYWEVGGMGLLYAFLIRNTLSFFVLSTVILGFVKWDKVSQKGI